MHDDLGIEEALLLQTLGGSQFLAAVDEMHLFGDLREVERLLRGRVSASHDGDGLVAVEGAVTGGAPRHAAAGEIRLARNTQLLGDGSGSEDDHASVHVLAIDGEHEVLSVPADRLDGRDVVELGARGLGLPVHQVAQILAAHAGGEARVVLHPGGGDDLPSGEGRLVHDRLDPCPRGVDGRRQPGRPSAHDRDIDSLSHSVLPLASRSPPGGMPTLSPSVPSLGPRMARLLPWVVPLDSAKELLHDRWIYPSDRPPGHRARQAG